MIILGLTGSIAMGKSTVAAMFRRCGAAVFDADSCVHALLGPGGAAVAAVDEAFPGTVYCGKVDRPAVAARVFDDPSALVRLEAIIHPLVNAAEDRFLRETARAGQDLAILDVPLLFEAGTDRRCDLVAVVSAPAFLQLQRLLARPGMDRGRVEATLRRQMSDVEKRRRADVVIPTGLGRALTFRKVREVISACRSEPSWQWPPPPRYRNPSGT